MSKVIVKMSKKKPCGLDYCPQEEIIGAYASCSACAWGAENESKDKSKRLDNSVDREKARNTITIGVC